MRSIFSVTELRKPTELTFVGKKKCILVKVSRNNAKHFLAQGLSVEAPFLKFAFFIIYKRKLCTWNALNRLTFYFEITGYFWNM